MSPLYDTATETIVLQTNLRPGCYPFSLAWLPDVNNIIGWKTTPKEEIAVFERNVDDAVSVEVRTCFRTPGDAHLSFKEFKAEQIWRNALEMGEKEYQWLLAHSDYVPRCNATVQSEMPNTAQELQFLTKEQERELYRDWYPLANFDYEMQEDDMNETTADLCECTQRHQKCEFAIRDGMQEGDTNETTNEALDNTPPQRQSGSGFCDTLDDDSDFDIDGEADADSLYDVGDYTSIVWYAETMLNVEDAGTSEDMDEDEDGGVDIETFNAEPAHPPPTPEEKEHKQVTVIVPEPSKPVRRSKRTKNPTRKATTSRSKAKAATSPYALSSLKCPLCLFRPREGRGAARSLDRHTKRHDTNREVFVCLGVEGCERLFARRDAWVRHFDDKECPGECVKMRSSEYLQMFPGSEEKLKSHLERNHKF